MNDRFKLKCFNKLLNKMYEVRSVSYYKGSIKRIEVAENGKILIFDEYKGNIDNCILIQSTGLKDKNGKLIYEGDIIQIPDDYDTYGMFACEKREIYFNEGGFRLKPKWDKNSRGNWLEDTKDFEVIGNIYENKELLNEN